MKLTVRRDTILEAIVAQIRLVGSSVRVGRISIFDYCVLQHSSSSHLE
jgi:hypothetical protein